jgi:hypothetical protein
MTDPMLARAPEACTLPTFGRPLRLAEFDQLFADSLRGQVRTSATQLRWTLSPDSEARARDLTARESECCSFFTFTVTLTRDALAVDVRVPPAQVDVLDALQARATSAAAS